LTPIKAPAWKRKSKKAISEWPYSNALLLMSYRFKPSELIARDIDAYLNEHRYKSLLRFITCGSVDDGKSSLIGRLLYETHAIYDDQLAALKADSRRIGTQGKNMDFALLLDGLTAEREQGITIDVAYRFFATQRRKFIVADAPGHEQYTRNMITGASTADLAVILIDARKGIQPQTRRHSYLVHLLGIRHVVLAVNKLDLLRYDRRAFDAITTDYQDFARNLPFDRVVAIPISALHGDNITRSSTNTPWYRGLTLLEHLDTVDFTQTVDQARPFRMPVQLVSRPHSDFRGFAGLIASGTVRPGDTVRSALSGKLSTVSRIVTQGGDLQHAAAGQSVTLCLSDEIDCSRGDVLATADNRPEVADQFEASLVWMAETPLLPGREYSLKLATQTVTATVQPLKYRIDVNSQQHLPGHSLELNHIGVAVINTHKPIVFEPYSVNRALGGFILIDKATHATIAAGMLHFALRRSLNVHRQALDITREHHAAIKHQKPAVIWLTGISGAGKSTIANAIETKLARMSRHTFLLDGDNIRQGLNKDLGFTDIDRIENIRRIGEVAKLMTDAGLIVITAFISPFRAERQMVRDMMAPGEFLEVFVDTPLAAAEKRDVKGLYKKARAGQLKNFTGIDSPYEAPDAAEIHIDTTQLTPDEAADQIIKGLLISPH
jgi:bifunctional enzyme CysN/CysC